MSQLVRILRGIFVRCITQLTDRKLREYIEQHCFGCREPECAMNQMAHDICMMMSWEDQLIEFLPDILKEITASEISDAVLTAFENYRDKAALKKMLLDDFFCVTTFLHICKSDMCTDLRWQTYIARIIYKKKQSEINQIRQFGKLYYTAVITARKARLATINCPQ